MSLVKSRFYWPGMDGDSEEYVKNCPRCIRRKAQGKTAAKLVVVNSTYPMDLVWMDFLSLEMSLLDMLRLSQPGTNRRKTLPESYLIIVSVIMASLPGCTVTKVATLKVNL